MLELCCVAITVHINFIGPGLSKQYVLHNQRYVLYVHTYQGRVYTYVRISKQVLLYPVYMYIYSVMKQLQNTVYYIHPCVLTVYGERQKFVPVLFWQNAILYSFPR